MNRIVHQLPKMPRSCPASTCQVSAQSIGSGDRLLLCTGLFSIFLAGAAATRRDSGTPCLKAHMPARPSLQQIGAPDTIRTCDLCLRRATLYPAELRVHWGII